MKTPDGKEHLEATCASKEAREHLAAILEEESILRVNPKVILDDAPILEPGQIPGSPARLDTSLNPTESRVSRHNELERTMS